MELYNTNNKQISEGNVSELIVSIVIMGLLFVFYSVFSGFIPDDYLYFDIAHAVIYMSGILYLYKIHPINIVNDFIKPSFTKHTIIGLILIFVLYFQYYFRIRHDAAPLLFTSMYNYNVFGKIIYLLIGCIIIPVNEEILFRRYYYSILKNRYGILIGAVISILLFTGVHGFQSANISNIVLQGVLYTYIYEKTTSVWSSIIVHSFNNGMWFLITYIATVQ